jgi:hypothetical protein
MTFHHYKLRKAVSLYWTLKCKGLILFSLNVENYHFLSGVFQQFLEVFLPKLIVCKYNNYELF